MTASILGLFSLLELQGRRVCCAAIITPSSSLVLLGFWQTGLAA